MMKDAKGQMPKFRLGWTICRRSWPGLKHQFGGIAKVSEILEFSTEHFESDSIRTEKGD